MPRKTRKTGKQAGRAGASKPAASKPTGNLATHCPDETGYARALAYLARGRSGEVQGGSGAPSGSPQDAAGEVLGGPERSSGGQP